MAHPFMPMTNEMLKKLSWLAQNFGQSIKSPELPAVFENQELKYTLEINSQRSESNQSNLRTNKHY